MRPGTIILMEGVLSLALPIGFALLELRSLRGPGSPPPRPPGPTPAPVPPPPAGRVAPPGPALRQPARARVLEDA